MPNLTFERLTEADLPLVEAWLCTDHVRRWWGDPASELGAIRTDMASENYAASIVHLDGRAIGFVHWWRAVDQTETGFDLFIGEADHVGRGIGAQVIKASANRLFKFGIRRICVDIDNKNEAAISAFGVAGFALAETPAGRKEPFVVMSCEAELVGA
ncbi:MAG: GNAT family N-acetyltransferase [Pikeienuella sp.]